MSKEKIDLQRMPKHIAFIMDGNGRWATAKNKPRSFGHNEGLNAAKRIVKAASDLKISYVTLYVFSTENWKRTQDEVSFLMNLIGRHLKKEMDFYKKNYIRVVHSGDLSALPPSVQQEIIDVKDATKEFKNTTVNLSINYGGRDEIVRSVNKVITNKLCKEQEITINDISSNLDNPDIPDPDLIIRSAGEKRLSNFLLWQSAYSEFFFSNKLWPDWDKIDLEEAILDYQKRKRKFGGINE